MKGSRFSEEQIIGVLREHEAGAKTEEVCRRHGISSATLYKWKSKYGGLEVSEARRLKSLEDENRRLKRLLAESMLDNAALKDLLGKNVSLNSPKSAKVRTIFELSAKNAKIADCLAEQDGFEPAVPSA